jgi:hypothetical protein
MFQPVRSDARYTVAKEYCGQAAPRWVARFCGEWLGQSISRNTAVMLCIGHSARRRGCLVIEEQRA